jgi:hypothetical protein
MLINRLFLAFYKVSANWFDLIMYIAVRATRSVKIAKKTVCTQRELHANGKLGGLKLN